MRTVRCRGLIVAGHLCEKSNVWADPLLTARVGPEESRNTTLPHATCVRERALLCGRNSARPAWHMLVCMGSISVLATSSLIVAMQHGQVRSTGPYACLDLWEMLSD